VGVGYWIAGSTLPPRSQHLPQAQPTPRGFCTLSCGPGAGTWVWSWSHKPPWRVCSPLAPRRGQGRDGGVAFSPALGKLSIFFPISPERGKFLAKCFIHACKGGGLILFAPSRCCGSREAATGLLGSGRGRLSLAFLSAAKQTQAATSDVLLENLSRRGKTFHLIISTLPDVLFQVCGARSGTRFLLFSGGEQGRQHRSPAFLW